MTSHGEIRKQIHSIYDLISTAHHEAGHIVYGLLNYLKIDSVYIYQNKKNKRVYGITYYYYPNFSEIDNQEMLNNLIRSEVGVKYAGQLAERYHFKIISGSDKFPLFLKNGSSDDTLSAAYLIKKYNLTPPGKKRYLFKKKLLKEVSQQLQNNWDAVSAIAHGLFLKQTLKYDDLKEILLRETSNPKNWRDIFLKIDQIYQNLDDLDGKLLEIILS